MEDVEDGAHLRQFHRAQSQPAAEGVPRRLGPKEPGADATQAWWQIQTRREMLRWSSTFRQTTFEPKMGASRCRSSVTQWHSGTVPCVKGNRPSKGGPRHGPSREWEAGRPSTTIEHRETPEPIQTCSVE